MDKLDPDLYFGARYIGKREAGAYEAEVKAQLDLWLEAGLKAAVEMVLAQLSSDLLNKIQDMVKVSDVYCYGDEFLMRHFVPMLVELNATNRLPAVVFCLRRQLCVDLVGDEIGAVQCGGRFRRSTFTPILRATLAGAACSQHAREAGRSQT